MPLPITELSPDVRALAERLKATPVGEVCTYEDLTASIGREVRRVRYLVLRAQVVARREIGAIFANVTRVGYKRLAAGEAHKLGALTRQRIRRMSGRTTKAIAAAVSHANDMSPEERLKATAEMSALSLLGHMARDTNLPVPSAPDQPVPVAMAMRAFLAKASS